MIQDLLPLVQSALAQEIKLGSTANHLAKFKTAFGRWLIRWKESIGDQR